MAQSANMDASELARDIAAGLASATTATEPVRRWCPQSSSRPFIN